MIQSCKPQTHPKTEPKTHPNRNIHPSACPYQPPKKIMISPLMPPHLIINPTHLPDMKDCIPLSLLLITPLGTTNLTQTPDKIPLHPMMLILPYQLQIYTYITKRPSYITQVFILVPAQDAPFALILQYVAKTIYLSQEQDQFSIQSSNLFYDQINLIVCAFYVR